MPEPDTFAVLPWTQNGAKVARVWCICFRNREEREDPGAFLTSDCRGNLIRLQQEFEDATGLHLRAGTEPEMMWLKLNPDGTPSVEGVTKPYCYHIDQFSELQPVINRVVEYGQKLGLDMIQGDHEDAPGQIELNFGFDRAERTADNLSTFRQICKQVGRELGAFPCFMPKPFMNVSATGATTTSRSGVATRTSSCPRQTTRRSRAGRPLGDRRDPGAPARADAITCSTVNSYRRLWDTGFWAPVFADWGFQNRTTALRVSAPGRFEYRTGRFRGEPLPLARRAPARHVGRIENQIDPGDPEERNIYEAMEAGQAGEEAPMTFGDALDASRRTRWSRARYRAICTVSSCTTSATSGSATARSE
jgi:glutamine synthetase